MKKHASFLGLSVALCCAFSVPLHAAPIPPRDLAIGVHAGADDPIGDTALELIRQARRRVLVAGYPRVPPAVAAALRAARARGVEVRVVLDRTHASDGYGGAALLARAGIEVAINRRYPFAHDPFVVADDSVAFGSSSFARASDLRGAGRFSVLRRAPKFAESYANEFRRLYSLSGQE
ncbi:phospholipase D-like domain-containing protein [Burkholderia alba]|uniref:phospholipase D-like domain-containing protein n=1 Tax=Burkholderia alba TaxID=2683677 RepID=UPI002B0545B0|nr:phospholipase D-like domain-containing protein [Burkholderia alba]